MKLQAAQKMALPDSAALIESVTDEPLIVNVLRGTIAGVARPDVGSDTSAAPITIPFVNVPETVLLSVADVEPAVVVIVPMARFCCTARPAPVSAVPTCTPDCPWLAPMITTWARLVPLTSTALP